MGANLTDTYDWLVAALEAAGLTVVTDPRNARPFCVLVEPPNVDAQQNTTLVQLSFPITVLGTPPGNRDTVAWLLATVDDILGAEAGPTTGGPSTVTMGNQDLPAYQLTTTIQIRRT